MFYLDNFLKFPPGVSVPTGYYDNHKAAWVASDSGLVVKIVAVQNGIADLDIQGDDKPSDAEALAKLGITEAERKQLASLYKPGQSLCACRSRISAPGTATGASARRPTPRIRIPRPRGTRTAKTVYVRRVTSRAIRGRHPEPDIGGRCCELPAHPSACTTGAIAFRAARRRDRCESG